MTGHDQAAATETGRRFLEVDGRLRSLDSRLARAERSVRAAGDLVPRVASLEQAATRSSQDIGRGDEGRYQPARTVRWWALDDEARGDALARLQSWLTQVLQPSYGHLAQQVPACWQQHPLACHALDTLSELWSYLYLTEDRGPGLLAGQAEFQTLTLPRYLAQIAAEAESCGHGRP